MSKRNQQQQRPSVALGFSQELPIPPEVAARMHQEASRQAERQAKEAYFRDVFIQTWQQMYSHIAQELITAGIGQGSYKPLSPDVCRVIATSTKEAAGQFMKHLLHRESASEAGNPGESSPQSPQTESEDPAQPLES